MEREDTALLDAESAQQGGRDMATNRMKVVDPTTITDIVNKNNFRDNLTTEIETSEPLIAEGLSIGVLPIDISEMKQMRHVVVEPNSDIPEHAHEGPAVRLITSGSAIVNGETYEEGDWMSIPARKNYKITSKTGYKAWCIYIVCGDVKA